MRMFQYGNLRAAHNWQAGSDRGRGPMTKGLPELKGLGLRVAHEGLGIGISGVEEFEELAAIRDRGFSD